MLVKVKCRICPNYFIKKVGNLKKTCSLECRKIRTKELNQKIMDTPEGKEKATIRRNRWRLKDSLPKKAKPPLKKMRIIVKCRICPNNFISDHYRRVTCSLICKKINSMRVISKQKKSPAYKKQLAKAQQKYYSKPSIKLKRQDYMREYHILNKNKAVEITVN